MVDRTEMGDTFDSLGRDWYGYDPDASPEELWEHNRGQWDLIVGSSLIVASVRRRRVPA
jgi:phage tail protein X